MAHLVSLAGWVAEGESAQQRGLAVDLAGAAAEVQAAYDSGGSPRPAVVADYDPALVLRFRADTAGGFLAAPAGEVRAAFGGRGLTPAVDHLPMIPPPARAPITHGGSGSRQARSSSAKSPRPVISS